MRILNDETVWQRLQARCEQAIRLDDGEFDEAENIADQSCLGTAVTSEAQAIHLVLVGMDQKARDYFALIRKFALLGFERNEPYVYRPTEGQNIFAKYMAMRIAALAEWVLDGQRRSKYLFAMVGYLDELIECEYSRGGPERPEPEVLGRFVMHLAQIGRWEAIAGLNEGLLNVQRGGMPWRSLTKEFGNLANVILKHGRGGLAEAALSLDPVFRELTNTKRHKAPYDERLTANDIVTIAEIRARYTYDVTDPWITILSIRDPEVVHESKASVSP